jgi:hypothetical protein
MMWICPSTLHTVGIPWSYVMDARYHYVIPAIYCGRQLPLWFFANPLYLLTVHIVSPLSQFVNISTLR